MLTKQHFQNAIVLMRIPFSVFLMPIFWFALSHSPTFEPLKAFIIFMVLHLFLYPASNGYNSLHDKDTTSIGGLEKPPEVNPFLHPLILLFDSCGLLLSFWISLPFGAIMLIYTLASKAYSHPVIRLKRYPITSTVVVTGFQGFAVYLGILFGLGLNHTVVFSFSHLGMGLVSTLFLMGSYPITQIYQHKEDQERGDQTLSLKLGVKGTFIFSGMMFFIGFLLFAWISLLNEDYWNIVIFMAGSSLIMIRFSQWMFQCFKNEAEANFSRTMAMNRISSLSLSAVFILILLSKQFQF